MGSEPILNFATLLAPISGDKPTGADPRSDITPTSPYYKIKGDRNAARAAERVQPDPKPSDWKPPDWKRVKQLGTTFLAEMAKDLEITAYLIEALVRENGFAGLRDGFRLARELVEKFWDGLYPLPDEEGLGTRIGPLVALNGAGGDGTLIAPIRRVPITDLTSVGKFALADHNRALSLKKLDLKVLKEKEDKGEFTPEKFEKAVAETTPQFYQTLVDDLIECTAEFTRLSEVLDKRCNGKGMPTSSIRAALTGCLDIVREVAGDKLNPAAKEVGTAPKENGPPGTAAGAKRETGAELNREQALENVRKAADFFRRTEPHSPVSYQLDQAVRWGQLALPELLAELIPEEASRKNVFKQVGIRPPEEKKKT
jgi:type VI secretion system protein ImpA